MTEDLVDNSRFALWWWLFPLSGFPVNDESLSLNGNCTDSIAILRSDDVARIAKEHDILHLDRFLDELQFDHYEYYIAIRSPAPSDSLDDSSAEAMAEEKAETFVSLLMLYKYMDSGISSCGLTARIVNRKSTSIRLLLAEKSGWGSSRARRDPLIFGGNGEAPICAANETLKLLTESLIGPICEVVLASNNDKIHENQQARMVRALKCLTHAMYINSPGEILTGVWLLVEILVSENQSKDANTIRRISALTNWTVGQIETDVYKPRNQWVHTGTKPSPSVTKGALNFALLALMNFAKILHSAPCRMKWDTFVRWLDLRSITASIKASQELTSASEALESVHLYSKLGFRPKIFFSKGCLYCKEEKDEKFFNREHVVPQSMGLFDSNLVLDSVCKECNDYFGAKLDGILARDSIEAMLRFKHRIKDPRKLSELGRNRLIMRLPDDDSDWSGALVELYESGGEIVCRPIAQIGFFNTLTDSYEYLAYEDLKDLSFASRGELDGKNFKIFSSSDEDVAKLKDLVEKVGWNPTFTEQNSLPKHDDDDGKIDVSITYRIDRRMKRAIAKIAFNYFTYVATSKKHYQLFGHSDVDAIRLFARYDKDPLVEVSVSDEPILHLDNSTFRQTDSHLLTLDWHTHQNGEKDLQVRLSLFNHLTYTVTLIRSFPDRPLPELISGHQFDFSSSPSKCIPLSHVTPSEPTA